MDISLMQLVKEQYVQMKLEHREQLTHDMKKVLLVSRCKTILFNDWGVSNPTIWDKLDEYAELIIFNDKDGEEPNP